MRRYPPSRRRDHITATSGTALFAVLALTVLVGCSSKNNASADAAPSTAPSTSAPVGSAAPSTAASGGPSASSGPVQKVDSIAAELPDAIKSSGVIHAVIDPGFPVNNYYDTDGKTVIGVSPDLLEAVGQVLGVKIQISTAKLATIIPALQAGRFDMAGMVLTDSAAREAQVDLIDFEQAGQELLVQKGNPSQLSTMEDTCGHTIAVAEGGHPVALLTKQSASCTAAGKKAVTIKQFPDVNQAILAVQNNRADATITDFTKSAYEVGHSKGTLEQAGDPFAPSKAGWAVPKNSPLTPALSDAIDALIQDGTYASILAKWQIAQAKVSKAVVNGAGASAG